MTFVRNCTCEEHNIYVAQLQQKKLTVPSTFVTRVKSALILKKKK